MDFAEIVRNNIVFLVENECSHFGPNLIYTNQSILLLLIDRTNGRTYATVLRPSSVVVCLCVCQSVCDVMYLNGAS